METPITVCGLQPVIAVAVIFMAVIVLAVIAMV